MPLTAWASPSVDDVGAILRARTADASGDELGTFTSETRPTDVHVQTFIENAVTDIKFVAGSLLPESYHDMARRVATLGAALEVELSFYPDDVAAGDSPYAMLKERYDELRLILIAAAQSADPDDENPADAGDPGDLMPEYNFPPLSTDLVDGTAPGAEIGW